MKVFCLSGMSLAAAMSNIPASAMPSSPVVARGKLTYGSADYTCAAAFPTAVFSAYYSTPLGQQVQPIIIDEIAPRGYPLNLTSPTTIPTGNTGDPIIYPPVQLPASQGTNTSAAAFTLISAIVTGNSSTVPSSATTCEKCTAALTIGQELARRNPSDVPKLLVNLCTAFNFTTAKNCQTTYEASSLGASITQVLAYAQVSGLDGRYLCYQFVSKSCSAPTPPTLNLTKYFSKPKPANYKVAKATGKRIKVLHLSDFHLDPRYKNGAEANCTSGLCCRANNNNTASPNKIQSPASRFGAFKCDVPYDLALSALEAIPKVSSPDGRADFALTLYTGDLVAHDSANQLSRAYHEEIETVVYRLFRRFLGKNPIYAALGNHDTVPVAQDAPRALPAMLSEQDFSWNYNHVASLWHEEGWLNSTIANNSKAHYGAYSTKVPGRNLRIITINTDFWYRSNFFNYINMSSTPDLSGSLAFLRDELAAAEDRGERVWIVGHVLSGWDGSNALKGPTDLFYAIVDRYAPHVIANIFFGHTHEDQFLVWYKNNGTKQSADNAIATAWVGPSITPLTNLNSGFRIYEVDTGSFDIYDAYTYYANVSTFATVEARNSTSNTTGGISYKVEYSTREAYDPDSTYPADQPLNATFWHRMTENLQNITGLMNNFTRHQGKMSDLTKNCTSKMCVDAKVCYMRSGSVALGEQCIPGFASVQGSSS